MHTKLKQNQDTATVNISDRLNRPLRDLRISVTDRCNFRCRYCMPERPDHRYKFMDRASLLSFEEIVRTVGTMVKMGVTKVRLTGGEPLLRPNLGELIGILKSKYPFLSLALTTNGYLLAGLAEELKSNGLDRLTVSLDSLDNNIFRIANGNKSDVEKILKGISAAQTAGFSHIKINATIQKGINDISILPLARYFKGTGVVVRFIEYMDVGNQNNWSLTEVLQSIDIVEKINRELPIEEIPSSTYGEVAKRYRYRDGQGEIGVISSVSKPFCNTCTRIRLSADGKLFTCLFATQGTDFRLLLRNGSTDEDLLAFCTKLWDVRDDQYSNQRTSNTSQASSKVEMYQIGG